MRVKLIISILILLLKSQALVAKEIVVGIEKWPIKKLGIMFTPIVIPDFISAKIAIEYKIHNNFSLIIPVEGKLMDYNFAIKTAGNIFGVSGNIPESWYAPGEKVVPGWNINFFQLKVSSGLGIKWFPFSEPMKNGFFLKTSLLAGIAKFNAYGKDGKKDSAVFTHVFTTGYTWVWDNGFMMGFELGEEYSIYTNPIEKLPNIIIAGLNPILQFSMGWAF